MASSPVGRANTESVAPVRAVSAEAALLEQHAVMDQTPSDADQTASDTDQTTSDTEQSLAESDQVQSDADQGAADDDQAAADRETAAHPDRDDAVTDAARETRLDTTAARARTT
jgi:hypothetical protein